jgi:hypothetical protein
MNCGVLLTYERRGSIVRLYASGAGGPLRSPDASERNPPAAPPRCVVCNEPLIPVEAGIGEEEQLA